MNIELAQLMNELEQSNEKTNESSISIKINKVTHEDQSLEAIAERIAFGFCEDYQHKQSGWGTYFGPMMVWMGDDGKAYESPSIFSVTEEIMEYWISRSKTTPNPILKARYCGLIWDLSKATVDKNPDYTIAVEYVNALLDITNKSLYKHPNEAIKKITRAYKVATGLNNHNLINSCIESAINLEDRIAEDNKAGLWGFCFDLFVLNKSKYLSEVQQQKLVSNLEARLLRVSKLQSPWICEAVGIRLATYYRSKQQNAEVIRIINIVGKNFESSCNGLAPIQASSWLQHIHDIYISFNMKDDAERVTKKITEVGPGVVDSMQMFSHSVEIPKEQLDSYLDSMTKGGLENTLIRIGAQFIPKKDEVEQQVLELAENYPLTNLFTKTLQDHKGRPLATIGSVEEDLEGRIIHQLSSNLNTNAFFLRHSLKKALDVYNIKVQDLTDFVFKSPIFEETKKDIINAGLQAYLNQDYISAIHILVPQTEAAIRSLVELAGGATLRRNRQGGLQLRTFDDLLRDDKVEECFGIDLTFYFRILLTEQRGWNVRNNICHGISPSNAFSYSVADRIMHVILCLAQVSVTDT